MERKKIVHSSNLNSEDSCSIKIYDFRESTLNCQGIGQTKIIKHYAIAMSLGNMWVNITLHYTSLYYSLYFIHWRGELFPEI